MHVREGFNEFIIKKDVANLITGIREERDFTTKELYPLPKFIPSTCTVN